MVSGSFSQQGLNESPDLRFVAEEFLALGATQVTRAVTGILAAGAVLAWMAATVLPLAVCVGWFLVLAASQAFVQPRIRAAANGTPANLPHRMRRRIWLALFHGSVLALSQLAFPLLDIAERSFFTLILLSCATGAIGTGAGYPPVSAAYAAPMVLPLIALWGFLPAPAHAWLGPATGILLMFYAGLLFGFARRSWATFSESCLIRFREREWNERLREALDAAESASRAKTRFLAAASHDLRQPLHTMTVLTSALSLRPLDERSGEIAAMLETVTQTLSEQLDDLLDISKLDAGIVEVRPQTFRAADIVHRHYLEIEGLVREKRLQPVLDVRSSSLVRSDPQLFARILRNLTHNAIKFTDAGRVTVAAHDESDHVRVVVEDTGIGIAPHHHGEVFQEFFQAHNPERDRSKGLGLGLSIVQRLSQLLGIALRMESAVGSGTRFELLVPTTTDRDRAGASALETAKSRRRFDLAVLVVDDEQVVRRGMRLLLEELGCRCIEAADRAGAVGAARASRPNLVLADFRLRNDDSGLAVLDAVEAAIGPVPCALLTGDTAPERLREAKDAGRRLLHKPLGLEQLRRELDLAAAARLVA